MLPPNVDKPETEMLSMLRFMVKLVMLLSPIGSVLALTAYRPASICGTVIDKTVLFEEEVIGSTTVTFPVILFVSETFGVADRLNPAPFTFKGNPVDMDEDDAFINTGLTS
jgi:hypothetical protein